MQRRSFLKTTILGSIAAGSLSQASCNQATPTNTFRGKRLIILRLDGGNDALFMLAPSKNEMLQKLRSNLYKYTTNNGIEVDGWILNKHCYKLHELMLSGDARIIPNVGYPENLWSGSHFISGDIWETGTLPGENSQRTGWIGRLLDQDAFITEAPHWPVLKLDEAQRMFDRGRNKTGIHWFGNEVYNTIKGYADEYYSLSTKKNDQAYYTYLLHQTLAKIQPASLYTQTSLGQQLAYTESIVRDELPIKVINISQTGYDTHIQTTHTLPLLYEDLATNLKLFVDRLKSAGYWRDTQVFLYSEFGRTLDENTDGGTDHGTAGHIFSLGGIDLFDGSKFNSVPSFNTYNIGTNHYLKHQIDYRQVLKNYEETWLV